MLEGSKSSINNQPVPQPNSRNNLSQTSTEDMPISSRTATILPTNNIGGAITPTNAPIQSRATPRQFPWLTTALILLNIIIYFWVFSHKINVVIDIITNFGFTPDLALAKLGILYMPLTHMFLHENINHLLGNMFFLGLIGFFVEKNLGAKSFLLIYFGAGILETLVYLAFNLQSSTPLIGASAAIYGLMAANYALKSSEIPESAGFGKFSYGLGLGMVVFYLIYNFFFMAVGSGHIAYLSHLVGFVIGYVIARKVVKQKEILYRQYLATSKDDDFSFR